MFNCNEIETLFVRQVIQGIAGEAVDGPLVHRFRAETLIEIDTGLVPVKAPPFDAAAALARGDTGDLLEQSFAAAFAAMLGLDIEVFDIQAGSAKKGREVIEIQDISDFLAIGHCKNHFCPALFKYPFSQSSFIRDDHIRKAFVIRQFQYKLEDQLCVIRYSFSEFYVHT